MDLTCALVPETERASAIATLVVAFAADPIFRWLWPEPGEYLTHFPALAEAFGGAAFGEGTAWRLGDFHGAALWMAPGVEPDGDATVAKLESSISPDLLADAMGLVERMDELHPSFEHWYLPWIGVDVAYQGQGLGSALMRPCLGVVDQDHLPAYLDSTNPRNIPFYERHGFTVINESRSGSSPPMIGMLRDAR
jgi:ribosomal protein S18 acetylase RimI-like enzyme